MKAVIDIVIFAATAYLVYMMYQFFVKPELKKQIQKEIIYSGINNITNATELKMQVINELRREGYIVKPIEKEIKFPYSEEKWSGTGLQ